MLELTQRIKLLKNLDVTDLAGEKVMIDFESGKYFMLSGSANDIWEMLQKETSLSEIVKGLISIYDVDEEQCLESTKVFLDKLAQLHIIAIDADA